MPTPKTFPALFAALVLLGGTTLRGNDALEARADVAYASRYVFRGVARAGQSAQAGFEISRQGWRGGVWANEPFAGREGREVDVNLAFGRTVQPGVTLEATAVSRWYPGTRSDETRRSFEVGLTATFDPLAGFAPSLTYSRDIRLEADQVQVAVARSFALTNLGAFLEVSLFAGQMHADNWRPDATGPARRDGYGYWGVECHVPYRIGMNTLLVGGLHYADAAGRSELNGPAGWNSRQHLWVTLGVSLDF